MPVLFIPVGIPGCGKSSLAPSVAPISVSSDAIRAELTGSEADQSVNAQVFERYYEQIDFFLRSGRSVFADATNLDRGSRAELRRIAEKVNEAARAASLDQFPAIWPVTTHMFLFRNTEQAIVRNQQRERVVPPHAMLRMIEKYERAVVDIADEPYDFVTEVSAVR